MATVHSYLRFSDEKQADGRSSDRQHQFALDFCKEGNHQLSNLRFDDKGKSGYRGDKQRALKRFLSEIGKQVQPGDILFVEAIDRLGRKGVRATQDLVNKILNAGIDIAIALPIKKIYRAADTNNVGDAIELAAFAFQAHVYSQNLSKRISDHWEASRKKAVADKRPISGIIPCWLVQEDGHFKIIPDSVAVIKFIFQRTIEGIGAKILCKELNEKFDPIGGRKSSTGFNSTFIRNVIRGRAVLGEYTPHVFDSERKRQPLETIKGYYPAIIDEEVWLAANAASDNRTNEKGPSGDFVNVFVGLVQNVWDKCPVHICSYQQTRANGEKVTFRRLKSYNAIQNIPNSCTATVEVSDFEQAIFRHLVEVDPSIFTESQAPAIELLANKERLAQVERQIAAIQEAIRGNADILSLIKPLKDLEAEKANLCEVIRQQAAKANATPGEHLDRLKAFHQTPNTPENRQKLREALKQVITNIWLAPIKLGINKRDPVAALIEINFVGGHRKKILLCNKKSITFTDFDPTEPSIADTANRDKLKKQMLELQKKGLF